MFSHIIQKVSARACIDVAEQAYLKKVPKNVQHLPRFDFTPKTALAFPKTGVLFLL